MDARLQIVLLILMAAAGIYLGYQIGQSNARADLDEALRRIHKLENPIVAAPQRFRQRTSQADENRQTRVRVARLRAKRSRTPDPRR